MGLPLYGAIFVRNFLLLSPSPIGYAVARETFSASRRVSFSGYRWPLPVPAELTMHGA